LHRVLAGRPGAWSAARDNELQASRSRGRGQRQRFRRPEREEMAMRLLIALVMAAALAASAPGLADVEPRPGTKAVVAVFPFTSPHAYSVMGRNAQEAFVTQLVKEQKVRVIQATEVGRMLRRRSLHWTGTIDPHLLRAARTWLKADYMLAGKLRFGGDAYVLSAHVANLKTLETTFAEDVDFSDITKMRIAVRSLARKIAGQVSSTGSGDSGSDLFLNVNARAFYDTAEACIRSMGYAVSPFRFSGTVDSVDEESKTVRVRGSTFAMKEGLPFDIYSTSGIDEPVKVTTVYLTKKIAGGFEARYRMDPENGIELGAKVTNFNHKWTVAVGKVEDEVEDNDKLVKRFRSALLEKLSEGEKFQEIEGGSTDILAKLSNRRTRFFTFKELWNRGVDLVLEGKFYGSSGSRRAHFKIYSTMTGKVWAEPKFETSL
jgi:TolB-like protein